MMPTRTDGQLLAGRYRVIQRLGAGGMAAVYLAEDERLHRRVAIKRMHTAERDDVDARRFKREARLGASLSHPNLVSIFDTDEDDESVLLVMEYVDGDTLADWLARGGLEPRRAVTIVRGVADALDHAHAAGIVHRDIKPANVLLGRDGSVKLADLGIAKALERTDITDTGMVLGTPTYMAPEQLQGGDLDPTVDVYALASMAFEMLTGRKPRRGRSAVEIAHQVVNEPPPDARDSNPHIPAPAAEAIRAGMAKDPSARPRTAGAFADQLARGLEHARPVAAVTTPTLRHPQIVRPPARQTRWAAVGALAALAIAALAIVLSSGGEEEAPDRAVLPDGVSQQERDESDAGAPPAAEEEPATEKAPATEEAPTTDVAPAGVVPEPLGHGGSEKAHRLHADGHAALQSGDYDTAIKLNTRAIEAFPEGTTWERDINYAYALFSLGSALRLAGRPDEAIPVLEARLEIPNQTETVRNELSLARQAAAE
jgi:tRNA A-37 threonylcarbamoyl transferase component Bud32